MAKIKKEQLQTSLINKAGLISYVAQGLGVSRTNVYKAIKRYHLEDVLDEARETTMDLAESQLFNAIRDGDMQSVFFYLKTVGRKRGYSEKTEIDVERGPMIVLGGYHGTPKTKDLSISFKK